MTFFNCKCGKQVHIGGLRHLGLCFECWKKENPAQHFQDHDASRLSESKLRNWANVLDSDIAWVTTDLRQGFLADRIAVARDLLRQASDELERLRSQQAKKETE